MCYVILKNQWKLYVDASWTYEIQIKYNPSVMGLYLICRLIGLEIN